MRGRPPAGARAVVQGLKCLKSGGKPPHSYESVGRRWLAGAVRTWRDVVKRLL
jgi:hypothetical protein